MIFCRSYRNPNQAEIMANFSEGNTQRPRTVPVDSIHNRPIVPSPYFFRQSNNPYNKLGTSSSAKSRKSAPSQLNFDGKFLKEWYRTCTICIMPSKHALGNYRHTMHLNIFCTQCSLKCFLDRITKLVLPATCIFMIESLRFFFLAKVDTIWPICYYFMKMKRSVGT